MRVLILAATSLSLAGGVAHAQVGAPPVVVTPAPPMRAIPPARIDRDASLPGDPAIPVAASDYRRPSFGWRLPRSWAAPDYHIADTERYDLRRPAFGYGWSRYHDDAVLTDRYGRVYDWREGVDWDRKPKRKRGKDADIDGVAAPHWDPDYDAFDDASDANGYGEVVETVTTRTTAPAMVCTPVPVRTAAPARRVVPRKGRRI